MAVRTPRLPAQRSACTSVSVVLPFKHRNAFFHPSMPHDWCKETIILTRAPVWYVGGGAGRKEKKEWILALGPILSTRTPVKGARMYSMNIDTEPSHEMSDSDLSCNKFAL